MKWMAWCAVWATIGAGAQTAPQGNTPGAVSKTNATVTFYSGGSLWKTGLPGVKSGVFQGCIFEKEQQLVCLRWREYAVVEFAPGVHVFSASLSSKHGAENSQTPILLEASKSYYLRAENERVKVDAVPVPIGMVPVVIPTTLHPDKGRLDIVTCEVARTETADSVPAGTKIGFKDWKRRPRDGAPVCEAATPAAKSP